MKPTFNIHYLNNIISINNCHFSNVNPGWSYNQHYHSGFELLHCYDGMMSEWIHGESINLQGGDWLLIVPGIRHSTLNPTLEAFSYFTIHYSMEDAELRNELNDVNFIHIRDQDNQLATLLKDVWIVAAESIDSHNYYEVSFSKTIRLPTIQKLQLQSLLLKMLATFLQISSLSKDSLRVNRKTLKVSEIDMAHTIERMLTEAVSATITINQIASGLYISRSHCNAVFKKIYGIAPKDYYSLLKLKKAKDLILHSGQSMEDISQLLGFNGISTFSRQFRRWTGLSPLQFRNQQAHLVK